MDIKKIHWLTYASLMSIALGLFTSITFSALHHIFLFIPCIYFLNKTDFKKWPKSAWVLLALVAVMITSVIFNRDIMVEGYAPLTRLKYYLFGLLGIAPVSAYFNSLDEIQKRKRISWLLYSLIMATTLASISGMSAVFFGYNLLKLKQGFVTRNGGLAGMLMNYAHNLSFFMIFLTGLLIERKFIEKYINMKFLSVVWLVNFLALYTTYTRGVWLAFLMAIPFYFFKKDLKHFFIMFVCLGLFGLGAYKIAGKSMIRPLSDVERMSQWKAAYASFQDRPLLGVGYMNFEKMVIAIKKEKGIEAQHFGGHAHSNYFEMLASTGLLGASLFILWQIVWFIELSKKNDVISFIGIPLIIVFVIGGLTQATFTLGANLFLIMPLYCLTQISEVCHASS